MAKQVNDNTKFTGLRLPKTVKPLHYDITLKPNLKQFTFTGSVKIDYEPGQTGLEANQQEVVLNTKELEIVSGKLGSSALSVVTYGADTETATLSFDSPIPPKGTIELQFNGTLNDQLKGFYRTEFDLDGTHIVAATTQFESTDARRCFPCWDEPAVKAEFTVTVVYPSHADDKKLYQNVALSNMPVVSSGTGAEGEWAKFDKTPKMSTYLLAVIVGPFDKITGTDGKRSISVYTVPGKVEQGRFALEVATRTLPYYEQYFGVEYPLKKSDLIAIPDFACGAMENWGLVTYRETALLVDPKGTTTARKQYIAIVVAHELAHQWFGNLVTMEWWTHLWLNEGFASFMEYLCVDNLYPEFDVMTQFLCDNVAGAFELDALNNSHPIEVPVNAPSEIDEIFDSISYHKGASVIRMMYSYIGDADFRVGMKNYLNKFAYSNAITEDLWDALGSASKKPIRELMSGWTSQKGFPWLSVSLTDETKQEGDKLRLTVSQSKFAMDGKVAPEDADTRWQIPLTAIAGNAPTKAIDLGLLKGKQSEVSIDVQAANEWIKLNAGSIGYYRVAYSEDLFKRLLPVVLNQTLPRTDRLNLQSDYFALCQAGCISTTDLFQLLDAYRNETDYSVWSSIDSSISVLSTLLSTTDSLKHLHSFGRSLYSEIFKKVTWEPKEGEDNNMSMLRGLVINRLVAFGDENVIKESLERFKNHVEKKALIPADLRRAVYKAVVSRGGVEGFDQLIEIYRKETLHEEKNRILISLGFAKDEALLKRAVDFALSDEVKNQDRNWLFFGLSANNPAFAFRTIRERKDDIKAKLGDSGNICRRMFEVVFTQFTSEESAREVEEFFKANPFKGTDRAIKQAVERIRVYAQWLARDGQSIKAYLSSK